MKLISAVKQKLKKKLVRTIYTAAKPYEIQVGDQPKLAGKTAVVTGGSGAIGRAVCVRLAAEGACVYVGGRREESVMKVVDEIRGHGLQAEPLLVDVTSADSIDAAFDGVFADRKLDVLVCCAGGGASKSSGAPVAGWGNERRQACSIWRAGSSGSARSAAAEP